MQNSYIELREFLENKNYVGIIVFIFFHPNIVPGIVKAFNRYLIGL